MQHPIPGPGDQSQYTVAGVPFALSGSGYQQIDFPYLTQWIWIHTNSGTTNVAFTQNGLTHGYLFSVGTSTNPPIMPLRLRSLFVSGSGNWEVVAGLTMVQPWKFPALSGAFAPGVVPALSDSVGFGYVPGLG